MIIPGRKMPWLPIVNALLALLLLNTLLAAAAPGQTTSAAQSSASTPVAPQPSSEGKASAASQTIPQPPIDGRQPKRILWIIPNYRAVSASVRLPPISKKDKLWLATEDSFDYSSLALAGIVAGISQAQNGTPQFDNGMAAYGRYLWHSYADEVIGNYFTEALLPIVTWQDPRYYTLGPRGGSLLHRTGYALTRLVITRNDAGKNTFNSSEIVGNLLGAGVSDFYYPRQQRTLGQTGQKWGIQLGIDAVFNVAKEFWPDIDNHIFHGRYGADH